MTKPDPIVSRYAADISKVTSLAVQSCLLSFNQESGSKSRVDDTYIAACGVIGALHILACILGHHGDKDRRDVKREDVPALVNPTSTLVAALLAQSMSPEAGDDSHDCAEGLAVSTPVEFGPAMVFDAIQQVERLTGRPVDGFLNPQMLSSLREVACEGNEPMNKFLAQRRGASGSLH